MIAPDILLEGEDTDDVVSVVGGVVGLWTGVDADTGIGKLSVWSKANGLKEAAAALPIYEVDSSDDGSRVAFVREMGAEFQLVTSPSTFAAGSITVSRMRSGTAAMRTRVPRSTGSWAEPLLVDVYGCGDHGNRTAHRTGGHHPPDRHGPRAVLSLDQWRR